MTTPDVETFTDEKLVEYIRGESQQDFKILVERYQTKLYMYVLKHINNEADAKDIVQESFIKMYVNLNSFDAKKKFSPWAYRITHNELVNRVRKAKNEFVPEDDAWIPDLADNRPSPAEEFDKKLSKRRIYAAVMSLPLKYREVLILHYFEGLSYAAIADIIKQPVSTVSTRISRAKAKLKKLLRKEDE